MKFKSGVKRAEISNAIDVFVTGVAISNQVNRVCMSVTGVAISNQVNRVCMCLSLVLCPHFVLISHKLLCRLCMLYSGWSDGEIMEEPV